MRIKGWSSEVALGLVNGYVVVTRYTDPANNSDKYRRFITLSAAGEPHLHLQHTGRWTTRTDMGRWIEGVWRPQGVAKPATLRRFPDPQDYNNEMVRRKIGSYRIVQQSRALTTSEIRDIITRAELEDASPAPAVTPTPPAPATRPISGQPSKKAATPVPVPDDADLPEKLDNLLTRASTGAEDQFDLFADLAILKSQVKNEIERTRRLEDQLRLVTETIMNI